MKTILIMAAGRGSRYGALKQFDQLGPSGEFLFEFSIHDALTHGFEHVVLVTRKTHVEELREYLGSRLGDRVRLDVLAQEDSDLPTGTTFAATRQKPWGTAHAVWTARKAIEGHFVVINADDYYGARSMKVASEFIDSALGDSSPGSSTQGNSSPEESEFGLVPYKLSETLSTAGSVSRAVCHTEGGYLVKIYEYKEILSDAAGLLDLESGTRFEGDEVTSMNLWIFSPLVFSLIESDLRAFVESPAALAGEEIYIPKQVQEWIEKGLARVRLTAPCEDWFGVTYAEDKARAVEKLAEKTKRNKYPVPLWTELPKS